MANDWINDATVSFMITNANKFHDIAMCLY